MNKVDFLSLTYNKILSLSGFVQLHRHSTIVIELSFFLHIPVPSLLSSVTNGVTLLPTTHIF